MHPAFRKITVRRAFTLVEVAVILVILALLIAILLPAMLGRGKVVEGKDPIAIGTPIPEPTPRRVSILPVPSPRATPPAEATKPKPETAPPEPAQ